MGRVWIDLGQACAYLIGHCVTCMTFGGHHDSEGKWHGPALWNQSRRCLDLLWTKSATGTTFSASLSLPATTALAIAASTTATESTSSTAASTVLGASVVALNLAEAISLWLLSLWSIWLLIGPVLGVGQSSWGTLNASLGLGRVAWIADINPLILGSRERVLAVPVVLGGDVGTLTEARVLWESRRWVPLSLWILGEDGGWNSIKLGETSVSDGRVAFDWVLKHLLLIWDIIFKLGWWLLIIGEKWWVESDGGLLDLLV